jgi:hypothetical protein
VAAGRDYALLRTLPRRAAGPPLRSARSNFAVGDYETASFAALKSVEVEVRRVSGLPNELVGVPEMRQAFNPKSGPLRDPGADGGEQQATADLFAVRSVPTRTRRATELSGSTTRSRPPRSFSWPTFCLRIRAPGREAANFDLILIVRRRLIPSDLPHNARCSPA